MSERYRMIRVFTPEEVERVRVFAAGVIGVDPARLLVNDHRHECLREGAWSIAYEGASGWPFEVSEALYRMPHVAPPASLVEPVNASTLAIYPVHPEP